MEVKPIEWSTKNVYRTKACDKKLLSSMYVSTVSVNNDLT